MNRNNFRLADVGVLILLFLQYTDTYKLLLIFIGKDTRFFSVFTICALILFLIFSSSSLVKLFKNRAFRNWFALIFTLPLSISTLHLFLGNVKLSEYFFWSGQFVLNISLFSSTVLIFSNKSGLRRANQFYILCVLAIAIGIIISLSNYDFIRQLMALNSSTKDKAYNSSVAIRAVGFASKPNLTALSLVCSTIILLGTKFFRKDKGKIILFIGVVLTLILLTGSRTSLFAIALVILLYIQKYAFRKSYSISGRHLKNYRNMSRWAFPIVGIFMVFVALLLLQILNELGYDDLVSRFSGIFIDNGGVKNDASAQLRITVIGQYWNKITDSIFIGYGPSLRNILIEKGVFVVASQNQFLEDFFAYGVFYLMYFLSILAQSYLRTPSLMWLNNKDVLFFKYFIVILIFYGFSLNYLLINNVVIISLGTMIGLQRWVMINNNLKDGLS